MKLFLFLPYLHSYLHLTSMLPFSIVSTLCLLMESSVNNVLTNDIISALILNLRISIYSFCTYKWDLILISDDDDDEEGRNTKEKVKKKIYSALNIPCGKFTCMKICVHVISTKMKRWFFPIFFCSLLLATLFVMCEFFFYFLLFRFILPLILLENCLHGYNLSLSSIINQGRRGEWKDVSRVPRNYVWNLITMCKFSSFRFSLRSSIFIAVNHHVLLLLLPSFVHTLCMLLIPQFCDFFSLSILA